MKHVVVNKVVDESVQEGYVQRLSKGQAAGVEQLEEVRYDLRLSWKSFRQRVPKEHTGRRKTCLCATCAFKWLPLGWIYLSPWLHF